MWTGTYTRMFVLCTHIVHDSKGQNNLKNYSPISASSHRFSLFRVFTNLLVPCLHSTISECNNNEGTPHFSHLLNDRVTTLSFSSTRVTLVDNVVHITLQQPNSYLHEVRLNIPILYHG
jgi:hypothetical protein